jgi:Leucine-rich repeat (LRR) protein
MTFLVYLYLNSNQLSDTISSNISQLSSLHDLEISGNHLSGIILAELGNVTLVYLYLDVNQLTGTLPESVIKLIFLERNAIIDCSSIIFELFQRNDPF